MDKEEHVTPSEPQPGLSVSPPLSLSLSVSLKFHQTIVLQLKEPHWMRKEREKEEKEREKGEEGNRSGWI